MREFLIDPKRDPEQEYTIHLFEFCNLRCAFCWQNHEDTIGIDYVMTVSYTHLTLPTNREV